MATADKIEVGDIVKLITHPTKLMTVKSFDGKFVECFWENDSGALVYRNFEMSSLVVERKKV
jgi:hypothetical protein